MGCCYLNEGVDHGPDFFWQKRVSVAVAKFMTYDLNGHLVNVFEGGEQFPGAAFKVAVAARA